MFRTPRPVSIHPTIRVGLSNLAPLSDELIEELQKLAGTRHLEFSQTYSCLNGAVIVLCSDDEGNVGMAEIPDRDIAICGGPSNSTALYIEAMRVAAWATIHNEVTEEMEDD